MAVPVFLDTHCCKFLANTSISPRAALYCIISLRILFNPRSRRYEKSDAAYRPLYATRYDSGARSRAWEAKYFRQKYARRVRISQHVENILQFHFSRD